VPNAKLTATFAVAILIALAFAAAPAFARSGPEFYIEGSPLAGSETIESQASGNQVLKATGVLVECTSVQLASSKILEGAPGTGEQTLKYGGCEEKSTEGKTATGCEARTKGGTSAGVIETVALKSELGFKAATGSEILTLFAPKVGTEFVAIEFKGANCYLNETKVNGSVALENPASESVKDVLTAPATAIKKVFTCEGTEAAKPKLTVTGGFTATYSGKAEVWLNGANTGNSWGTKE
jgi:hypothetical protein